jgi:hypothetical protein
MIKIRDAVEKDISEMVALSAIKRRAYAQAQPLFWKPSPNAQSHQKQYFFELLSNPEVMLLIAESHHEIDGFIIGSIVEAPSVYNPGGKTLLVDDFCVRKEWPSVAPALLQSHTEKGKKRGVYRF